MNNTDIETKLRAFREYLIKRKSSLHNEMATAEGEEEISHYESLCDFVETIQGSFESTFGLYL